MVGAIHQEVVAILGLNNVVADGVELHLVCTTPQGIGCAGESVACVRAWWPPNGMCAFQLLKTALHRQARHVDTHVVGWIQMTSMLRRQIEGNVGQGTRREAVFGTLSMPTLHGE